MSVVLMLLIHRQTHAHAHTEMVLSLIWEISAVICGCL